MIRFNHKDDIYYVREGFSSDGSSTLVVEGQWRFDEEAALIRMTNKKGATLTWYSHESFNGKTMEIAAGQ